MVASARVVTDMRGILGIARKLGLRTGEMPGWTTRGRSILTPVKAIAHHTAATIDVDRILRDGRPGLTGPLANFALHADGAFIAVAAGTANHAGEGIIANAACYGTECTGPPIIGPRYAAYVRSQAAICLWHKWQPGNVLGHCESCLPVGRKPDPDFTPASCATDMGRFRAAVAAVMTDFRTGDDMTPEEVRAIVRDENSKLYRLLARGVIMETGEVSAAHQHNSLEAIRDAIDEQAPTP
jgi:hypothetical protein